jgi:FkbM family methyltransferase
MNPALHILARSNSVVQAVIAARVFTNLKMKRSEKVKLANDVLRGEPTSKLPNLPNHQQRNSVGIDLPWTVASYSRPNGHAIASAVQSQGGRATPSRNRRDTFCNLAEKDSLEGWINKGGRIMGTGLLSFGSWLKNRNAKPSREQQILDEFSRELDLVETQVPMMHGYSRIDPYVIDVDQAGVQYQLIIYHTESKAWFDNDIKDAALVHSQDEALVQPGFTVFDLGCNSGFLTNWFAKRVGPTGKVLAFDPFPWNTLATLYSAKLNGFTNVQCHTLGIADTYRKIQIPFCDSKTYENAAVANDHTFTAKLVPLDEYKSLRPDFIKVDIEGAERDLLKGSVEILNQNPKPIWFLEIHNEYIQAAGHDPNQIAVDYTNAGYDCHIGHPRGPAFDPAQPLPNGCALFAVPRRT